MMVIPRGKEVKIALNGVNILQQSAGVSPDTRLVLASELTINLHSDFSTLLGDNSGGAPQKLLNSAGAVMGEKTGVGFSTAFKEQGFRQWTSTDPVRFSVEVFLSMRTSGYSDVLAPAQVLMAIPLPKARAGTGLGLQIPGPSITTAMGGAKYKEQSASNSGRYAFRCGIFYLPLVIIEGVEPTFSSEVDSDGYPIWCSLKIDVTSVFTATQEDIKRFGYSYARTNNDGDKEMFDTGWYEDAHYEEGKRIPGRPVSAGTEY